MSLRVLGCGNTGMMLASKFDEAPILLSTAKEDTRNFQTENEVITFSEDGASKRFRAGVNIWERNFDKLKETLSDIRGEKVLIFSSLGGGSGSSSLNYVSKALLENENKVLIVGIQPYKLESNPPLSNFVQSINNLMPIIPRVSVILFDNDKLRKLHGNNWENINKHIIKRVDYLVNLLSKYASDEYSPLTLDQSELESVIFGGGFLDYSEHFIEETMPKFSYGGLDKTTKNCLVAMFIPKGNSVDTEKYHKIFTENLDKVARRAGNARMIPGIIRATINHSNSEQGIKDRAYITIASGLTIEKYLKKFDKVKELATKKAVAYSEEYKGEKFIDRKNSKILDI